MQVTRAATLVHKWLALLMAVQILFWVASGLFFAAFPIERVRSEHRIAEAAPAPLPLVRVTEGLARLAADGIPADKVDIEMLLGRPVAVVTSNGEPHLYDLASGGLVSPLGAAEARRIAVRDAVAGLKPVRVSNVTAASPEYRGALPAWRIDFEGDYSVYVAANTGRVTARRSDLWRIYDTLWSLHIMDYRGHEDFNSPLLIAAAALGIVVVLSGIVMLPSRLGLRRRKKTPAAKRAAGVQ